LDDAPRLPQRARQPEQPLQRACRADGLETRDLDEVEVPAEIGQHARFDTAPRADELDRRLGLARTQLLGDRDAGKQVPARAAACDEESHDGAVITRTRTRLFRADASRFSAARFACRSGRRPTFRTSPTRNIVITSELPP